MNGVCKISDFGLSTLHESVGDYYHTYKLGTPIYAAPEQMSGAKYNCKVDIFSLGCILVCIFVKFPTDRELISAINILKQDRELHDKFKNEYQSGGKLILDMTEHDPKNRIDINRVIERQETFNAAIELNVVAETPVVTENVVTSEDRPFKEIGRIAKLIQGEKMEPGKKTGAEREIDKVLTVLKKNFPRELIIVYKLFHRFLLYWTK
jgi:serine/threonine protein kinase